MTACFGNCSKFRLLVSGSPIRFHLWAPGQSVGKLWDSDLLIFPLFVAPPYRGKQGFSHSQLEWQHMCCLPSSSRRHPQSREDQRLSREERVGLSHPRNQKLLFPLPQLGLTEPCPPLSPVGRRDCSLKGHNHLEYILHGGFKI